MKRPGIGIYEWWGSHPMAFDLLMGLIQFGSQKLLRTLSAARTGSSGDDAVLDLGCGTGPNVPYLRRELGSRGRIVALDFSDAMVRAARARVASDADAASVEFVRGDGRRLGFDDEAFDGVLATLVLSALPDYERVIEETYRVIRPGGRFVVLDGRPFQRGAARLLNPVVVGVLKSLTNWYPSATVLDALDRTFDDVSVETFNAGALYLAVARRRPNGDPGESGGLD